MSSYTYITNDNPFGPTGREISVNQDGIEFSGISCGGANQVGKAVHDNSYTAGGTSQINIINAVDIDWNNAKLGEDNIIQTTGQLLSYISYIANRTANPTAIEITFS